MAQAGVAESEAALTEARVKLEYTDIVSPVDGIVVSRNVDVGQTVAASFQTPVLFVIAEDLTRMQVAAQVSEADVGQVREGQSATFTVDAYPGRAFPARVSQVRNAAQTLQNVVTYDVILDVDNREGLLKPGMTASARIVTDSRDDVLRIPTAALRFRPPSGAATGDATGEAAGRRGTEPPRPSAATTVPRSKETGSSSTAPHQGRVYRLVTSGLGNERPEPVEVSLGLGNDQFTEVAERSTADEAGRPAAGSSARLAAGDQVVLRARPTDSPPPTTLPGFGGPPRRR